jgi:hypothetical protein
MSREPDKAGAFRGGNRGVWDASVPRRLLSSPSRYLRLRLSLAASNEASCAELFDMARRYRAKAEASEREDATAVVIAQALSINGQERC